MAVLEAAQGAENRARKHGRVRNSITAARQRGLPAVRSGTRHTCIGLPVILSEEYNGDKRPGDNLYCELHSGAGS